MLSEAIGRYRAYLLVLARREVPANQQARVDPSGVVQQTLLDAHDAADVFDGLAPEQRLPWLRTALARNLADAFRRIHADKRDARRERAIAASVEGSADGLEHWLAASGPSPSRQADRNELLLRLASALAELPEAQRLAIERHYFDRLAVAAIASEMGKTTAAVAGLLKRGLQALRELLRDTGD
jgi:RNA polymerase sigma-70 factor (ECF subfamily)